MQYGVQMILITIGYFVSWKIKPEFNFDRNEIYETNSNSQFKY